MIFLCGGHRILPGRHRTGSGGPPGFGVPQMRQYTSSGRDVEVFQWPVAPPRPRGTIKFGSGLAAQDGYLKDEVLWFPEAPRS